MNNMQSVYDAKRLFVIDALTCRRAARMKRATIVIAHLSVRVYRSKIYATCNKCRQQSSPSNATWRGNFIPLKMAGVYYNDAPCSVRALFSLSAVLFCVPLLCFSIQLPDSGPMLIELAAKAYRACCAHRPHVYYYASANVVTGARAAGAVPPSYRCQRVLHALSKRIFLLCCVCNNGVRPAAMALPRPRFRLSL